MKIIDLDPQHVAAGVERLRAQPTLGMGITIPALAEACSLGNIDPQHTGGDAATAAITLALAYPVPSDGAAVAVLRPGADAVGAAAVLSIRHDGVRLTGDAIGRVFQVADADTEAAGPWPGPRPIGSAVDLLRPTSALVAACMDHNRPLPDRVAAMREWILTGRLTEDAEIRLRLYAEALDALDALDVQVRDGLAVVTGSHRLATAIGYRHAPVVVATDPAYSWQGGAPHLKHTIARWNTSQPMGWTPMLDQLRNREPGWGGSSSICGSPQGTASALTQDEVLDVVARHLPS